MEKRQIPKEEELSPGDFFVEVAVFAWISPNPDSYGVRELQEKRGTEGHALVNPRGYQW